MCAGCESALMTQKNRVQKGCARQNRGMNLRERAVECSDPRRPEKLQFCVQVFIVDIELQELTEAGGKPCVLYYDMTESEL